MRGAPGGQPVHTPGKERFVNKVQGWENWARNYLSQGPDGTICVFEGRNRVAAYSPKGKRLWEHTHQDARPQKNNPSACSRFFEAPSFDDGGNAYIGTSTVSSYPEGYLKKLDKDGNEAWSVTIPSGLATQVKIGPDGKLYCGTSNGYLLVFNKDTGREEGRFSIGRSQASNFAFGDDGELYVNTEKNVLALQLDSNKLAAKLAEEGRQGISLRISHTFFWKEVPGSTVGRVND